MTWQIHLNWINGDFDNIEKLSLLGGSYKDDESRNSQVNKNKIKNRVYAQ